MSESRSSGESRTSSPSYQSNYGESRESRGSSYTPQKSSKTTKRKSKDIIWDANDLKISFYAFL